MGSRISIIGLVHTVDVKSYAEDTDAAGGIIDGTVTVVYNDVKCRITMLTGEDIQLISGLDSAKSWKIIMMYSPDIALGQTVTVPSGTPALVGVYRILWFKHQIDEHGKYHHTSLIVEKDD